MLENQLGQDQRRLLGRQLALRRKELGLTLREVAKRAGLSITMLSQLENGKRRPSIQALEALSVALDCIFQIGMGMTSMKGGST